MAAPAAEPAVTASAHVKRVAVVGGGTMGNGIAQVFATSGFDVELVARTSTGWRKSRAGRRRR